MKKILFLHGFGSSGATQTAEYLRHKLPEAEVISPDIPLDPEKAYTLTSNSFMLKDKGDGYAMFADCEEVPGGGIKDVQAVIDYLEELTPEEVGNLYADPHGQGRITILE